VDNKFVGGQFNGWAPFRLELTSKVSAGQTVDLKIRCQDPTANIAPEKLAAYDGVNGHFGAIIAPVGGYKGSFGLWDSVRLESTPIDELIESDLVIVPSVRKSTLTVVGRVDTKRTDTRVGCVVSELDGTVVRRLPAVPVSADGSWKIEAPFPNARYWSPEDPHLYNLRIEGRSGESGGSLVDSFDKRFGFKEIWTSGPDIYLNGLVRHLLGASQWPETNPTDPAECVTRLRAIRESGAIVFRLHTAPWRQAWLDAADQVGILVIDEGPMYTPNGDYAWADPRLWTNYREQIAGMIVRDRNHASLAMYSLENETLFMSNQKYSSDLSNQLGSLADYARSVDPFHPLTFEADRDPEGKADVIGLHYPHEAPGHFDYPNTADWLSMGKTTTDAIGGMLGTKSASFEWDRKKPLYIGEYLWDPAKNFSVPSIFYGDDAYVNRDRYYALSQIQLYSMQTIAYRRVRVSGMSPWVTFGFGGVIDNPAYVANQKRFYQPVAAYLRDYGLRAYSATSRTLTYDVFNDSTIPRKFELTLTEKESNRPLGKGMIALEAAGSGTISVIVKMPTVAAPATMNVVASLHSEKTVFDRQTACLQIVPHDAVRAPKGYSLVTYDPKGSWPGSVPSLASLMSCDPTKTVVIVAPYAMGNSSPSSQVPTFGDVDKFDMVAFRHFLTRGGSAIVLEQSALDRFGLGVTGAEKRSTLSFALNPSNEFCKGLKPDALSYWGPDNYVANCQIQQPISGGGRALVVTGGPKGVNAATVVDVPVGVSGRVIFMQALAGTKRDAEPAAERLVQNAIDSLCADSGVRHRGATLVIESDTSLSDKLRSVGVAVVTAKNGTLPDLRDIAVIAINGTSPIRISQDQFDGFTRRGGIVYWLSPSHENLSAASKVAASLTPIIATRGTSVDSRTSTIMDGITRQNMVSVTDDGSWEHNLTWRADGSSEFFVPQGALEAALTTTNLVPDASPSKPPTLLTCHSHQERGGFAVVVVTATANSASSKSPVVNVYVNDSYQTTISISQSGRATYPFIASTIAGDNVIRFETVNVSKTSNPIQISSVCIGSSLNYPEGVQVLSTSGSLLTWQEGPGRFIIDGTTWLGTAGTIPGASEYANALFSNMGARFDESLPDANVVSAAFPLGTFHLSGSSPYFRVEPGLISFPSNGTVESDFNVVRTAKYVPSISGYSTQAAGVFGQAKVIIDDKLVGIVEIKATKATSFDLPGVELTPGSHKILISFINDALINGEDRNLYITGVSVKWPGK
jgi:hypothetical protein